MTFHDGSRVYSSTLGGDLHMRHHLGTQVVEMHCEYVHVCMHSITFGLDLDFHVLRSGVVPPHSSSVFATARLPSSKLMPSFSSAS